MNIVKVARYIESDAKLARRFFEGLESFAKDKLGISLEYESGLATDFASMKREKRLIAKGEIDSEKHWDIVVPAMRRFSLPVLPAHIAHERFLVLRFLLQLSVLRWSSSCCKQQPGWRQETHR